MTQPYVATPLEWQLWQMYCDATRQQAEAWLALMNADRNLIQARSLVEQTTLGRMLLEMPNTTIGER